MVRRLAEAEGLTADAWLERASLERSDRERIERDAMSQADMAHRDALTRAWVAHYSTIVGRSMAEAVYGRREQATEAAKLVAPWLESNVPCLVLCGGVGTGKTVAALVALRELCGLVVPSPRERHDVSRGIDVWTPATPCPIVRATKLAVAVDPWKHERDQGAEPLSLSMPFLCIDDLGAEFADPRFHAALFAAIDARQSPETRTLITTNLRREEIRPRYGDRIADRLNAMAKVVQLRSTSLRRQDAGL